MGFFDFIKQRRTGYPSKARVLSRHWSDAGVDIRCTHPLAQASVDALLAVTDGGTAEDTFLAAYLSQLVSEGHCAITEYGMSLPWALLYELSSSPEHEGALQALELPSTCQLAPILASHGDLSDAGFNVYVDGWAEDGHEVNVSGLIGGIAVVDGKEMLLSPQAWATVDALRAFGRRGEAERTQHANELSWGVIRAHADSAGALYRDPYLETTFVLTPETLRLPLHKESTPFGRVITVEPTFAGAPPGWLKAFDGFNSVQQHYDFTRSAGHVRVVVSEPVRKVLSVIKREMPGRKVAGARAERFLHNPWAFLGESAHEVLREDDFAADKAGAGALAAVFSVTPRTSDGRIERVELIVTEHFFGGSARTETKAFATFDELNKFIDGLAKALLDERQRFPWLDYDLSIDGESGTQLEYARQVLHLWRTQPDDKISFDDIYELDGYSGRIEGIGVAKPVYVPLIKKPSMDGADGAPGWMPSDLTPMVKVTLAGHEGHVVIPLNHEWVNAFQHQVEEAERAGAPIVQNASLPTPVGTESARTLVDGFRAMLDAQSKIKGEGVGKEKPDRDKRETLLVKSNFHGIDYAEERKLNLALPDDAVAELPRALRSGVRLKKHQLNGIAWFQHLVSRAPMDCRGALLADDMGLGKTLQLLTVLGWYYEKNPNSAPSIILAPKSLVENWAAETRKFFTASYPSVLVLYDEELKKRKQPLALIDQELHKRGVVDLLKPSWAGDAKIIITTYEVLTHYEFSMARQPFAFAICDEAQRIKTPGTQAAAAAKALKADFRIACTGTPVENSLADLWCLFDFVQPGLLGGLEDFGRMYRRPIECETDEQKDVLLQLQNAIAPQTLRRTKLDIAGELKKKFFAYSSEQDGTLSFKQSLAPSERLAIPMSNHQHMLYLGGLKKLQDATHEKDGRKRARLSFGALHLMKAVCAEPYCLPGMKFLPDNSGRSTHLTNSPKLRWLIEQLKRVQRAGEKAIIFTEIREVQAALFYFMREEFALKPSVINGDFQNRQAAIDTFSKKDGFNIIILSTLAAGAGLNVTAANHVFHFTRAWNPSKENQATDRAYRIGQDKDVYVYCPVVVAEGFVTFDVRLDELLRRKAGLADATLGGSTMESMLNGTGHDVTFSELLADNGHGAVVPRRYLTMDDVDRMDGNSFEVLCKMLWNRSGFVAQLTPKRGGDGGIDVIAFKGREGELLQCKSSGSREVGWDAVKEVTAGAARYQAQFTGTKFRRLAVTNQRFNASARAQAEANRVGLVEREQIEELLSKYPIDNYQFDEELGVDGLVLNAA